MKERAPYFPHIAHLIALTPDDDLPLVGHLSSHLGIEGRPVEYEPALGNCNYARVSARLGVADELRLPLNVQRGRFLRDVTSVRREHAASDRSSTVEPFDVDLHAPLAGQKLGQVERETEGVEEEEGVGSENLTEEPSSPGIWSHVQRSDSPPCVTSSIPESVSVTLRLSFPSLLKAR